MKISCLAITAKTDSDPAAVRLSGQGGQIKEVRSASRGKGTTVRVKDLFYNTPARKIIDSPQTSNLREVIADLYDTKLAKSMIKIKSSGNQLRVTRLVSNPQYTRSNHREQFTFLNGRYVRNRALSYIIGKSYEGTVEKNRHPFIFLYIDITPQMVNVNVHPKKRRSKIYQCRVGKGSGKGCNIFLLKI